MASFNSKMDKERQKKLAQLIKEDTYYQQRWGMDSPQDVKKCNPLELSAWRAVRYQIAQLERMGR